MQGLTMQGNIKAHFFFISFLLLWLGVYSSTLADMVSVWLSSETYQHCFMILPIVLYLVHEKKNQLAQVPLAFNWWFLLLISLGQVVYLLADLSGINLIAQLAAYGTLLCLFGAIYGWKLFKFLIFPLCYLVLAVPMGEELVPGLQEITADISVYLVQLVGIPVYREGLYIYIPNGTFEVAEACAGIRFLIAMIAIGVLYAYTFYQSTWRRLVFVALSIVIPILANGVRAFGIIYIGHVSDMTHAVGADHLVYGWFFFAFVLLLLMAIGKLWREDLVEKTLPEQVEVESRYVVKVNAVLFLAIIMLLKPLYGYFVVGHFQSSAANYSLHDTIKTKSIVGIKSSFGATFPTADHLYSARINANGIALELFSAEFIKDDKKQELINWGNRFYDIDKLSLISKRPIELYFTDSKIQATLLLLTNIRGEKTNLIYWYQVGQKTSSNKLEIKMQQLIEKLSGGTGSGFAIALVYDAKHDDAEIKKAIKLL